MARRSSSPSPSRPRTISSDLASRASNMALGDPMDVDDDDDEETLQLKLEEIQAQLRLKKLRKDKARAAGGLAGSFTSQTSDMDTDRISRPSSAMPPPGHRIKEIRRTAEQATRPRSQPPQPVEVPASPVRKAQPPPSDTSPSRILLGIDKGLKAKDISLKRAPSFRKPSDDPGGSQAGGYLRTSRSFDEKQKPQSFSERLKAARDEDTAREQKRAHASRSRSTAFNVGRQEMEDYKTNATDIMDEPASMEREYTRDEILGKVPVDKSKAGFLKRSNTTTSSSRTSSFTGTGRSGHESPDLAQRHDSFTSTASEPHQASSSPSFEPYSCFHLNKRILPHQVVARAITGKTAYSIKDLLRQVKAPDWSLPDDVIDSVVFAVVASKTDPRHHKPQYDPTTGKMKPSDRGKYMIITLVDLEYEIDLYLFNTGFERFWKLSTGTVVAILNPDLMPPPPGKADTGRFSLAINSDADTILEIGVARDLGYCKSVKADGSLCNSWVNARRTEHCEFHTNTALARTRGARQELNSGSGFGKEGVEYKRGKMARYQSREQKEAAERRDRVADAHGTLDWETRSRFFVSRGAGGGGNSLNQEAEDFADTRERAEGLKRRLLAKEKERDIAKRLGEMGGAGMGGEYMRLAASSTEPSARPATRTSRFGNGRTSRTTTMAPPTAARFSPVVPRIPLPGTHHYQHEEQPEERKTDARSLGLLAPRGFEAKLSLSPIKRKRQDSSTNSSFDSTTRLSRTSGTTSGSSSSHYNKNNNGGTASSTAGGGGAAPRTFGWGTTLKDKLGRMRDGEKLNLNLNQLKLGLHHQHQHTKKDSTSSGSTTTTSALRDKDRSPVRKKTRFVTDKGIREAGRDSLPPQGAAQVGDKNVRPAGRRTGGQVMLEDDDDEDMDELVIVR